MSLQFILGNSGSGKSTYMYQQIVNEAGENPLKDYLVIVPEQFTMQTQRLLVDLSPNKAIMNIDVLSFKRLAYRVFDELGINNVEILEETGKNLVLRKVAQENEDKLTVLRPNMSRMGYITEVKSLLSELVQYNIPPQRLLEYVNSGKMPSVLAAKLKDVVTMYEGFESFMKDRFITAEEILNVLKAVCADSKMLQSSVLIFDEFTGFTPIQNQLLNELLPIVDKVYISLSIDANEDFYKSRGMHELFDMSKKTITTLMKMAERVHVEVLEPIVFGDQDKKRFVNAPGILFMEQNLFRIKSRQYCDTPEDIRIFDIKSPREELIHTARVINELIQKEGYRYREIAVVTGDVETYSNYVESIFGKYNIPYFLDKTKEVIFHPFIEFIRASLEVINRDFSYESVFRVLRCGFFDIEEKDLDILENYCLATGIRGKKAWSKRWLRLPRDKKSYELDKLEELRQQIYGVFEPLINAFSDKEATVRTDIIALYMMIKDLKIEEQLWEKEKDYLSQDLQIKSKEYGQIYQIVMTLFEKYIALLGEEKLSIQEFIEILDAGFDAAEVATIPPGYDSVTIGDIERTRLNKVKVLFFIGVNDGIVPKSTGHGGIISQYERQMLKDLDIELAPGAREQTFIQRFYLYLNMTKPSEKLYISYSRLDKEGKAVRPSYLIGVLNKLFPKLENEFYDELDTVLDVSTKKAAREYLIYGEQDEKWHSLAKWFMNNEGEEEKENIEKMLSASFMHYADDPISKAAAEAVYGKKVEAGVTRLERFARCAYSHYLQYGLKLSEREEAGFQNVDIGNIYHDALDRYSKKLANSEYDWFNISDENREEFADQAMKEAVAGNTNMEAYATAENMHMLERMDYVFKQTVWALTKQVRRGKFIPGDFEIDFSRTDDLNSLHYDLGDGDSLDLRGRIDRLDTCKDEGRLYVKIIDYKSGSSKLDLIKLYQGVQLQLVVYMNAALEKKQAELKKNNSSMEIVPGGILYYNIDDPIIDVSGAMTEEDINNEILKALKPDGLINSEEAIYRAMDEDFETDSEVIPVSLKKNGELKKASHVASTEEFDIMRDYASTLIMETGKDIYDGKISVNPLKTTTMDSCSYCPYSNVCGINSRMPGLKARGGQKLEKEEIYDKMMTYTARYKGNDNAKEEE